MESKETKYAALWEEPALSTGNLVQKLWGRSALGVHRVNVEASGAGDHSRR